MRTTDCTFRRGEERRRGGEEKRRDERRRHELGQEERAVNPTQKPGRDKHP